MPVKKKKQLKRRPTAKQIKAAKLMSDNVLQTDVSKIKTQEQILKEAGYSDSIARTKATHVTQSDGFQELLEKFLPDEYLFDKHKKILEKNEGMTESTPALRLAYDLKGKIQKNQINAENINLVGMMNITTAPTDPEDAEEKS